VLEVVEQEQQLALAEVARQRRDRLVLSLAQAQRPGHGRNDEARVGNGGEWNGDDAVGELVRYVVRYRKRQASLTDSACARDREQPHLLGAEELPQGRNLFPAADKLRRLDREGAHPPW
jgi:hypothetical protein